MIYESESLRNSSRKINEYEIREAVNPEILH